jgi:hypothetical protein
MAHAHLDDPDPEGQLFRNPWPLLAAALVILAATAVLAPYLGSAAVLAVLIGLILAGAGVTIRPGSSKVLAAATLCGAVAYVGMLSLSLGLSGSIDALINVMAGHPEQFPVEWDSARMVVGVVTLIALAAALLMLFPRTLRRIVVSIVAVVHFGGIISATMTVQPCPWLPNIAWMYLYRPYLELAYLTNAYHFYSPNPGPATLVWFYVKYEDGSSDWYKTPTVDDPPLKLEYLRRISLAEYTNQQMPASAVPEAKIRKRVEAGARDDIPPLAGLSEVLQYREPAFSSRMVVESYARRMYHQPPNPTKKVATVKIYRVIHNIRLPKELAEGKDPEDPNLYGIYYMGEYDVDGKLKDPDNPYLYWLIPSVRIGAEEEHVPGNFPFLEKHAKMPTLVR